MDPEDEFSLIDTSLLEAQPPDSTLDFVESRFGVELEICVKLSPDCIRGSGYSQQYENFISLTFRDKFNAFYRSILQKSPAYQVIAKKYKYLVLNEKTPTRKNHYFYDLQNPKDIGTEYRELAAKIDRNLQVNIHSNYYKYRSTPGNDLAQSIFKEFKNYKFPIVEEDLSIICGDSKGLEEKESARITSPFSFRFECITPVLTFKGVATHPKIRDAVMPMLQFFGFEKSHCFLTNYSMGYHVNASLFIPERDRYIAIGQPPLLNELLQKYIAMERHLYGVVRSQRPLGANTPYVSRFARPLYGNLNRFLAESEGLSHEEVIASKMTANNYIEEKYKAIKRKSPYLLEFRLFEGSSNVNTLINNIYIVLQLLHTTVLDILRREGMRGLRTVRNISPNNRNLNGGTRIRKRHRVSGNAGSHRRHTRKLPQK
jgi:hypothetical protein